MPEEAKIETRTLWCPWCGLRHEDRDEWATRLHHEHICEHCGGKWRLDRYVAGVVVTSIIANCAGSIDEADKAIQADEQDYAWAHIATAERALADLRRLLSDHDPDVVRLRWELERTEADLRATAPSAVRP